MPDGFSATTPNSEFPCIVFLYGIGNDKNFMVNNKLDLPFLQAGFAFACFDQLMDGERQLKNASSLEAADAFRVTEFASSRYRSAAQGASGAVLQRGAIPVYGKNWVFWHL
jgi:hypothetical protein